MVIANIVTKTTISGLSNEFNVVKSIDLIDNDLPTLIVGYDYVNKLYPDFDIMNINITGNIFWTFKRTEKRDKFEEDLEWFISKVYKDLINGVNYVFVDLIQYSNLTLWKIIRKIYSLDNKITYVDNDMIYIYSSKLIFGIDLKLLEYMSIDIDKIKNKIKEKSIVFLIDDTILIEYKKNAGRLGYQVKHIPFLYSINNG